MPEPMNGISPPSAILPGVCWAPPRDPNAAHLPWECTSWQSVRVPSRPQGTLRKRLCRQGATHLTSMGFFTDYLRAVWAEKSSGYDQHDLAAWQGFLKQTEDERRRE